MRNPNDPIPGFEDEFTGTVGKEKRIHKTQWLIGLKPRLRKSGFNSMFEWVETRPGRWDLKRKEQDASG